MAQRLSPTRFRAVADLIWPADTGGLGTYLLLDGARSPGIHAALRAHQHELAVRSLYQGEQAETLADVCPYIVRLMPGVAAAEWFVDQGWGQSWGVFLHAAGELDEVRRSMRRFTLVNTEAGKTLLFRFYDPRVLRVFLPTCEPPQHAQLFRDVARFIMEDEDGAAARHFEWIDGQLRTVRHPIRE